MGERKGEREGTETLSACGKDSLEPTAEDVACNRVKVGKLEPPPPPSTPRQKLSYTLSPLHPHPPTHTHTFVPVIPDRTFFTSDLH